MGEVSHGRRGKKKGEGIREREEISREKEGKGREL